MPAYRKSDIDVVYSRGDWHSWDDIVNWMERRLSGDQQIGNEFSEVESGQLLTDFKRLQQNGTPFTADPQQAFDELQKVAA